MKLLYALTFVALAGCSSDNSEEVLEPEIESKYGNIDSVLKRSQKNLITVNRISQVGDSSITEKVQGTVKKLVVLKQENKQLKVENNELKAEINDLNAGSKPYKLLPISNNENH